MLEKTWTYLLEPRKGMIVMGNRTKILTMKYYNFTCHLTAYTSVGEILLPPYRNRGLFSEDIKGQASQSDTEEQQWGVHWK